MHQYLYEKEEKKNSMQFWFWSFLRVKTEKYLQKWVPSILNRYFSSCIKSLTISKQTASNLWSMDISFECNANRHIHFYILNIHIGFWQDVLKYMWKTLKKCRFAIQKRKILWRIFASHIQTALCSLLTDQPTNWNRIQFILSKRMSFFSCHIL